MPKLTKEQRDELQKQLDDDAAEPDDDDDEVEIGLGEGKYFRGKMRNARGVAAAHGFKLVADEPKTPAKRTAPKGGGKEGDGDGDGQGGAVRFGRRVG